MALSLVVQGVLLPRVVAWAAFPQDTSADDERVMAERVATQEALQALPAVAARLGIDDSIVARARREQEAHLRVLLADTTTGKDPDVRADIQYTELKLELLRHKRDAVVRLRGERQIDDGVLRQVQAQLDVEELRLAREGMADD